MHVQCTRALNTMQFNVANALNTPLCNAQATVLLFTLYIVKFTHIVMLLGKLPTRRFSVKWHFWDLCKDNVQCCTFWWRTALHILALSMHWWCWSISRVLPLWKVDQWYTVLLGLVSTSFETENVHTWKVSTVQVLSLSFLSKCAQIYQKLWLTRINTFPPFVSNFSPMTFPSLLLCSLLCYG